MKREIYFCSLFCFCFGIDASGQDINVYFGNLHSHTEISDGSGMPDEAYEYARDEAEVDFLAITEHNHARGGISQLQDRPELYQVLIEAANDYSVEGEFVALYGQEFSSIGSGNHANVFDVDAVIMEDDVSNGEWDSLLDGWLPRHLDSQRQPAVLLLNHPALWDSKDHEEYGIDDFTDMNEWRRRLDLHAQLINIINGPSKYGSGPSGPSESEFLRYLNLGLHVAPTADQDNHLANWGNAAETRTAVLATSLTKEAILDSLRGRHVYATEDRNLSIVCWINGELIGTRFLAENWDESSTVQIVLSIEDEDEPEAIYTINVYADEVGGTEVADVIQQRGGDENGEFVGNGTYEWEVPVSIDGGEYLFLKITQRDGDHDEEDRVWLAPVWFETTDSADSAIGAVVSLAVNLETEEATIRNLGDELIDLRGWRLVSTRGGQELSFEEGTVLDAGEVMVVRSGPNAQPNASDHVYWTSRYVWANDGDSGELVDAMGSVVARSH